MHALEHLLLIVSKRISSGDEAPNVIAADLEMLASESHFGYAPVPDPDDRFYNLNEQWKRKYRRLLNG
jgi:hypothetical protein